VQWQCKYRADGAAFTKVLGTHPDMDLEAARQAAVKLRGEPQAKPVAKAQSVAVAVAQAIAPAVPTFLTVAQDWLSFGTKAPRTLKQHKLMVTKLKALHDKPIITIDVFACGAALDAIEKSGKLQSAHRAKFVAMNIFDHARRHPWHIDHNPCVRIKLTPFVTEHHAAIVDAKGFGALGEAIDLWGQDRVGATTMNALRLLMRTAVRQGELTGTTWGEFKDLDKPDSARWEIPASRMKMKAAHVVPLSRQALEILKAQAGEIPNGVAPHKFVFPAKANAAANRHISASALSFALDVLGYKGKHTPHGMRSAFSTLAREAGKDDALIEMCLAHKDSNKVRGAYDRSQRLDARRELMAWWSDAIETMQGC
jgi:integrase